MNVEYDKLDPEIRKYVRYLNGCGIETFESCQGGPGHAFLEPTIRFHGNQVEGFKAFTIARNGGLPVTNLRRFWQVVGQELHGPYWEMTFVPKDKECLDGL